MSNKVTNIIIVETSEIVYAGILSFLTNTGQLFNIHPADNLCELEQLQIRAKAEIILINPLLIQNQIKLFQSLKKELHGVYWIGIVYSLIDPQIISALDESININEPPNKIIAKIQKFLISKKQPDNQNRQQETLSERETDVLKLLVTGNANKEIADKLNISTHTVISHRKNISQKTGIKSVSGLTIYAVVNNIITIDRYREQILNTNFRDHS
jgi:DNA-binding CsgD family transcriptional regulator